VPRITLLRAPSPFEVSRRTAALPAPPARAPSAPLCGSSAQLATPAGSPPRGPAHLPAAAPGQHAQQRGVLDAQLGEFVRRARPRRLALAQQIVRAVEVEGRARRILRRCSLHLLARFFTTALSRFR
jgi:hypothetical protein